MRGESEGGRSGEGDKEEIRRKKEGYQTTRSVLTRERFWEVYVGSPAFPGC